LATHLVSARGHRDLRVPLLERATELFESARLPITPRLAGVFALDFAIQGVSKRTAVRYVLGSPGVLRGLGLRADEANEPGCVEVWGDRFSTSNGGTDRHISEALPTDVRSITFREEALAELPPGYNIVLWDGCRHLQEGLLEYLEGR
jgi:hypothetical protein